MSVLITSASRKGRAVHTFRNALRGRGTSWQQARAAQPGLADHAVLSVRDFQLQGETLVLDAATYSYRRSVAERRGVRLGMRLLGASGVTRLGEIEEAFEAARRGAAEQLALLKCTSAYPAPPESMNLRTIPHLAQAFGVPVGFSDHTMGPAASIAAVALGASIVEKHFTLSRDLPGPDSAFSMEPEELRLMVDAIRTAEKALGTVAYGRTDEEEKSLAFRRSLVVEDMEAGEEFTDRTIRCIRPGHGLPPRHLNDVLGGRAARDIARGTPGLMGSGRPWRNRRRAQLSIR